MKLLEFFLFYFFFDFSVFVLQILDEFFSLKKIHISQKSQHSRHNDITKILQNNFIIFDKKYPDYIHSNRPNNRTYHIVEPKFFRLHIRNTCDKRNKSPSEIMKFPKDNIPKSIFFDLFFEDFFFRLPESKILAVFFDNLTSDYLTNPVSKRISEHCSDYCENKR